MAVVVASFFCVPLPAVTVTEQKQSDPATEIRTQDSAFSLLIESYRQLQNNLIQSDYEARVRAAAQLPDRAGRDHVIALAKTERDLRVRKLCVQLGNMGLAYDYSRRLDEHREGITVPHAVNTDAAAKQLKNFVILVPPDNDATNYPSEPIPAKVILRDKPPAS